MNATMASLVEGNDQAMSLTEKELAFIQRIVDHNEYGEKGCLDNQPWSWAVVDGSKARAAILGSLIKKGLAKQSGSGRDANCWLTKAGKMTYLDRFGSVGVWSNEVDVESK